MISDGDGYADPAMDDDMTPNFATNKNIGDAEQPRLLPEHGPSCFGCGSANPAGLDLQVWQSGALIFCDIAFDQRHVGGPGLAHGGAIATAVDDLLGYTVWLIGAPAVTRALTIDYLTPVQLHDVHRITAKIDHEKGRVVHIAASGVNNAGRESFTAQGVFVRVPLEHFEEFGVLESSLDTLRDVLVRENKP